VFHTTHGVAECQATGKQSFPKDSRDREKEKEYDSEEVRFALKGHQVRLKLKVTAGSCLSPWRTTNVLTETDQPIFSFQREETQLKRSMGHKG
jgi:hypothetical protein